MAMNDNPQARRHYAFQAVCLTTARFNGLICGRLQSRCFLRPPILVHPAVDRRA